MARLVAEQHDKNVRSRQAPAAFAEGADGGPSKHIAAIFDGCWLQNFADVSRASGVRLALPHLRLRARRRRARLEPQPHLPQVAATPDSVERQWARVWRLWRCQDILTHGTEAERSALADHFGTITLSPT